MNIKELKSNTEKAITIILESMVDKDVKTNVLYDLANNTINVILIRSVENKQETAIVQYHFNYNIDSQTIGFATLNRRIYEDAIGTYTVNYEPVFIDEKFVAAIKNGIMVAIEHANEILAKENECGDNNDDDDSDKNDDNNNSGE